MQNDNLRRNTYGGINMVNELAQIQSMIYEIRGQKVMLDRDLAVLYEVEVKRLNEAVKRNIERFPEDFMFQLTEDERDSLRSQIVISNVERDSLRSQIATSNDERDSLDGLRSQIVTSKTNRGGRRYLPYAFTEHGVLMLSNVLNSTRAINMSIEIIRVFDKLRKYALEQTPKDIRIEELHKLLMLHIESTDHKFSGYDKTYLFFLIAILAFLLKNSPLISLTSNRDTTR
jgi:phage regulator Rha-like protein